MPSINFMWIVYGFGGVVAGMIIRDHLHFLKRIGNELYEIRLIMNDEVERKEKKEKDFK